MVKKKGKSNRVTLKDKYKAKRKKTEAVRKARKQAKRDAAAGIVRHDKKKKDPGIPSSWPFKEDLLKEIQRTRERAERLKQQEKRQGEEEEEEEGDEMAVEENGSKPKTLEELVSQAKQRHEDYDPDKDEGGNETAAAPGAVVPPAGQQSRRAYLKELRRVVDSSDVLLQVLDARDPVGTRMTAPMEDFILSKVDRRMILVLNKIDLIPKTALQGWLAHLRQSHATIAVRASTSSSGGSGSAVGHAKGDVALQNSALAIGMEGLLSLLKNYARCRTESSSNKSRKKTCITVGIIGYPNVGKSSILNSLKRSRTVGVSSRPGFTTALQEVVLDRNVRLVDSPGVVLDDSDEQSVLLRNCLHADSIPDPLPAMEALVARAQPQSLLLTYGIAQFSTAEEFLVRVAHRLGRVRKGGIPDKVAAARCILRDWNSGKIPYYTPPPPPPAAGETNAQVLTAFGKELDLKSLLQRCDDDVIVPPNNNNTDTEQPMDELDFVQLSGAPMTRKTDPKAMKILSGGSDGDSVVGMEEDEPIEAEEDDDL